MTQPNICKHCNQEESEHTRSEKRCMKSIFIMKTSFTPEKESQSKVGLQTIDTTPESREGLCFKQLDSNSKSGTSTFEAGFKDEHFRKNAKESSILTAEDKAIQIAREHWSLHQNIGNGITLPISELEQGLIDAIKYLKDDHDRIVKELEKKYEDRRNQTQSEV